MENRLWGLTQCRTRFIIFFYTLVIFLVGSLISPSNSFSQKKEKKFDLQVYLTKQEAMGIAFPGADTFDRDRKWLNDDLRKSIGELSHMDIKEKWFTFHVGKRNGKPMGYMLIDHIIGKSFPITFMTVINLDGTVRDVEILVYREPRGWEVKFPSFMSQFFGRNAQSDFREINSITGATLSVRAITTGVKKAVSAYQVLYLDAKK
jgi:H+/Na+-translocating ferredoxin:NAD+ oxidoreductase subunit G